MTRPIVRGFNSDTNPGLAPSGGGGGAVANSIALPSAAFNLLMRDPINIINGE
jgi:hypothetical protein